ncbi:outer membrane beta-barrel protein [Alkalimarinus sediminis]|uniref:Porin family protein n=1 Tax=Alkalimarinus sediminis TaxID=1632866 RepID=A0A9E8KRQ3_9ALTE|nr:outer membrane beta-barrel protein [Alkalimarinus sediminis]UZW76655.1 porin family protein [Alkalimarinus sediminis]
MKFLARSLALLALLSFNAAAQEVEDSPKKAGLDYFALNAVLIDFNSIGSKYTAKNWASTLTMGTYITDYVKTEMRFGVGLTDDTVPGFKRDNGNVVSSDLTMTLNHYASWYMGLHYPLAEWSSIYLQLGMSYIHADAEAEPDSTWEELRDDYPGSKFSMSWLAGFDFKIVEDWYVTAEAGRLHRSSASDIQTLQYGLGLKYEF